MKSILITTIGFSAVVKKGGGISAYTNDLANNLAGAGYKVSVFVIRENFELGEAIDNNYQLKTYQVPERKTDEKLFVKKLYSDIVELKPDVIIDNGTSYIPGLWSVLPVDIVKISVVHAFSPRYVINNFGIIGRMSTFNHEYADWLVCQNSKMADDISKRYKVPRSKLVFIPQTANHSLTPLERRNEDQLKILFGAGSRKNKGSYVMFEIAKLLKETDWNFEISWCSNAEDYKPTFIEDKRFVFPGHLSREKFLEKVQESDAIIIPTLQDTGPMLLVEAMSLGIVPICNNLKESAIPDIMTHGENGFVIDNNAPLEYKEVISVLIDNRDLVRKISKNAYEYFDNYLKPNKQIEAFANVFEKNTNPAQKQANKNIQIAYWHLRSTTKKNKFSFYRLKRKFIEIFEIIETKELS